MRKTKHEIGPVPEGETIEEVVQRLGVPYQPVVTTKIIDGEEGEEAQPSYLNRMFQWYEQERTEAEYSDRIAEEERQRKGN